MLTLLASLAFAQNTRVFETDAEVAKWIRLTRATMRVPLPVVGPPRVAELGPLLAGADVLVTLYDEATDPDQAAVSARSKVGAPCAIALAELDDGWTGWVSGHCGLLFLGAWRYEGGGRVVDDRGRPVGVTQFAADSGDLEVIHTYKKLDRVRGRAMWNLLLGTGLVYVGQIGLAAARNDDAPTTGWWVTTGIGGALTLGGAVQLVVVQADKRSHPRNLLPHYSTDEIKDRIEAHNARLRLVSIGPSGVSGTF